VTRPTIYLNGQYVPAEQAALAAEDRGHLFGDGVYEVVRYAGGAPFAMAPHVDRVRRSLDAIGLDPAAVGVDALPDASDGLVRRCGLADASVYWQVTRGSAPRSHVMPAAPSPAVLMLAYPAPPIDPAAPPKVVDALLVPDTRWALRWIKTLLLLPNSAAKTLAHRRGCGEAVFVEPGRCSMLTGHGLWDTAADVPGLLDDADARITEGSSTNVFAVIDGRLRTHPLDGRVLGGITRAVLLELAAGEGIDADETAVSLDELWAADELFIAGTTTGLAGVGRVDGRAIGTGHAGPITARLHAALMQRIAAECCVAAPR